MQTRYYDPQTGRFINIDDISYLEPETINGLNLYAYCGNDPINKYDPSGHFAISVGFLIGSILIGAATFGLAYFGGKAGLFNKIGDFKGWYDFYLGYGGMNNLKMISYISNLIIGPTLSKMLFISGLGAGIRWIIDKLIPEF